MLVVQRDLVWIRNALQYTLGLIPKVTRLSHHVKHKRAFPLALCAAPQCVFLEESSRQISIPRDERDDLR